MEGLWQHEWLCQEANWRSVTERDSRCLARKKLFTACAVSLVFMTGEAIGETKDSSQISMPATLILPKKMKFTYIRFLLCHA